MVEVFLVLAGGALLGLVIYNEPGKALSHRLAGGLGGSFFLAYFSGGIGRFLGRKDTSAARSVYTLLVFTIFCGLVALGEG